MARKIDELSDTELRVLLQQTGAAANTLARTDVNAFVARVLRDERTGRRVTQAKVHKTMQQVMGGHDRAVMWGFVEGGKCSPAGEPILLADGTTRAIEALTERVQVVLQDPVTMTQRVAWAGPVFDNGTRDVVEVVTKGGRHVKVTRNHPLATPTGWTEAGALVPGVYIAVARTLPEPVAPSALTADEAELLGYIVGDGGCTQETIRFSKPEPTTSARVRELCEDRGWSASPLKDGEIRLLRHGLDGGIATEGPRQWVARFGLNTLSKHKRVPQALFTASNAAVAAFIGAYFACDGHVQPEKRCLELASASRAILDAVRLLLARFGVVCRISDRFTRAVKDGPRFPSSRLMITGAEAVEAFRRAIPVVGPKGQALRDLVLAGGTHTVDDVVPSAWVGAFHRPLRGTDGVRYKMMLNPTRGNHRSVVRRLLADEPNEVVETLASDAVFWDRVVDVIALGPLPTYGITVDDPAHCYLQGDVLSHNSQQVIARSLLALGQDPTMRIAVVGNTAGQAIKTLSSIGRYIQHSHDLHEVFPKLLPGQPWRENSITVRRNSIAKDPSVMALGVHGAVLGARIDFLVLDDLVDFENSRTQHGRDDLYDWVMNTLMGRLTDGAKVICLGNAYHPDDMMHRLEKLPGWYAKRLPVMDENGVPVWPERWSTERISEKRRSSGPLEFARQMMCQARSDEDARFKLADIEKCAQRGEGVALCAGKDEWRSDVPEVIRERVRFYTGVDLAVQTHTGADMTCIFTLGLWPDGTREIVNIQMGRWQAQEILFRIEKTSQAWGSLTTVENIAAQDFIRQLLQTKGITTVPFTTGRNKASLEFQAEAMASEIAQHMWVIPSGEGCKYSPEVAALVTAMLYYNPGSHTPDVLAACLFARHTAARGGQLGQDNGGIKVLGSNEHSRRGCWG